MKLGIVSDTAGSKVSELVKELRSFFVHKINEKYSSIDINILIAIRCLPETHFYKSFTRYTKKDNCLVIDIYLKLEDYLKMYKVEQRFHLGNTLIEYLRKALEARSFDGLSSEEFIGYIKELGKETESGDWFCDEIDWSSDLDK